MSLSIIEEVFNKTLKRPYIQNIEEWKLLLKALFLNKIIIQKDFSIIPQTLLIFPISIQHFINLVTQNFCTDELRKFLLSLECLLDQINDSRTTIDFWAQKGLKSDQLKKLLLIFQKVINQVQHIRQNFQSTNKEVQKIRQSVLQVKDNIKKELMQSQMQVQRVKSAFQYQQDQIFAIEKIYYLEKVREVHYRNQPIKVLQHFYNGQIIQIGYNVKDDSPVQVVKLPKITNELQLLQIRLNSCAAYKQLFFSKYFPKYLGSNSNSQSDYNLFFMEYKDIKPVKSLIKKDKLKHYSILARYWAKEILLGLKDLLCMTTYLPQLPITVDSIHYSQSGINIFFKNMAFLRERQFIDETHERLEARLLKNYANLLLQIFNTDLVGLSQDLDFKFFIQTLLNAQHDQLDFQEGKTDTKLTFENVFQLSILKNVEKDPRVIGKDFLELFPGE